MRVLVTGHRGYIGSVVSAVLRHAACDVVGLDADLYGDCDFGRVQDPIPSFDCDLREVEFADLVSFDAVVHLAGLSDDESGDWDPHLTHAINQQATIQLAECCKQAGVGRFIFASSCAVYGRAGSDAVDEAGAVRPLSLYARTKLQCERGLSHLADDRFCPISLRLATAYGVSPRLRLDTVVNDFVASAVTHGGIVMKTNGASWRPLVHVEDVARVCLAVLTAPADVVHDQVFNVVPLEENYRIIDIADMVTESLLHCTRRARAEEFDPRSYRVDGGKLLRAFPKLRFHWNVTAGIRQLISAMRNAGLTTGDWRGDRYRRALRLKAYRGIHAAPAPPRDPPRRIAALSW